MLPAPLILWIMKPLIFADKGLFYIHTPEG